MRNRTVASLFLLFVAFFLVAPTQNAAAIGISITITFGHGENCKVKGGICKIVVDLELRKADGSTGNGNAEGSLEGNTMDVVMLEAIPDGHLVKRGGKNWLVLREDVACELSPELAKQLGTRSLTILKGQYEVGSGGNNEGEFSLKLLPFAKNPSVVQPGRSRGK